MTDTATAEHSSALSETSAKSFSWTPQKERAVILLAEDELTDKQIAEEVGVHHKTITAWKEREEFSGAVADKAGVIRASALKFAIAKRHRRLSYLQRMLDRMEVVIEDRARQSPHDVPGGLSGLVTSKPIYSALGDLSYEHKFDAALVREYRATMEQAAKELGQLTDKLEISTETLIRRYVGVDVEAV